MNRLIIAGLILAALLICGCADNSADIVDTPDTPDSETPEDSGNAQETSDIETEVENTTGLNISAEELEALGEELNQLEYEDLGGLSED